MASRSKNFRYVIWSAAPLLALLLLWEAAGRIGAFSKLALPLPSKVLIAVIHEATSPVFIANWGRTLGIWIVSLFVGLVIGLCLGFASGANRALGLTILPVFGYLRAIPPIAMFPVALIAIGPGGLSIGLVAALGAALYVLPGTAEATRQVTAQYWELAFVLGTKKGKFLRLFVAPGAALGALAASRIAATYAFAVCVAGEMIIGGRRGVGAAILDLSERYRLEEAYAYVICTGIGGLLIDATFTRIADSRSQLIRSREKHT
jgi:ABC-type nitrate/sulfonate/bicarbonate transport system permease component